VGRLEDWDSTNQLRADRDRELYGGDGWVERFDEDHHLGTAWRVWQWILMAVLVTLAVGGAVGAVVAMLVAGA
jgi:hypothetical protein